MNKRVHQGGKYWDIIMCNNYIRNQHRMAAVVRASASDFDLEKGITLEYLGKFYICENFEVRNSLSGQVELNLTNLVDMTRDIKLNLILNNKL